MNGIPFAAILLALSLLTLPAPGRPAPGVPRGRRRRVPVLCAAVLPAVATSTAGQNSSGLSLTRPNTAGSEPSGSSVAEMNETTKTVLSPNCGKASQ